MQDFKKLIELIEKTVDDFNRSIPGIQQNVLDNIRTEMASLQIKNGNIVLSVKNVRKIAEIKSKLQALILTPEYIESVKSYVSAFNLITQLQNQYFNTVVETFTPPEFTNEVKNQAIESAVEDLTDRGIGANVITAVEEILRQNITSGGSYSDLQKTLENLLTDNENGEGRLTRYAKQITTDAINQFSGQYTQIISNDLGFEWYRYSGSNIQTTRPFCLACTKKRWIHISEFPALIAGDFTFTEFEEFDGKLYKGKPAGMYEDTTPSNFVTKRGGHNCGHQLRPVSTNLVPMEDQARVYATAEYKAWARANGKKPATV
jgi:hypothetical protein